MNPSHNTEKKRVWFCFSFFLKDVWVIALDKWWQLNVGNFVKHNSWQIVKSCLRLYVVKVTWMSDLKWCELNFMVVQGPEFSSHNEKKKKKEKCKLQYFEYFEIGNQSSFSLPQKIKEFLPTCDLLKSSYTYFCFAGFIIEHLNPVIIHLLPLPSYFPPKLQFKDSALPEWLRWAV